MKRFNRQLAWGVFLFLLFSAVSLAAHFRWRNVAPNYAFITGWTLAAVMLFLTLYNVRKKIPFLPAANSETWLQLHIYAGYFAVVLFLIHLNFHLPHGKFEIILAALYSIVTISGIVGLALSRTLPRRLAVRGGEVIYEKIPATLHAIRAEAETLVFCEERKSPLIAEIYVRELAPFFSRPKFFWLHLLDSRRPLNAMLTEIDEIRPLLNEQERATLEKLATLVRRKDALDYHRAVQLTLKLWLFVHLPVTYSLMIFSIVHVVLVFAFSEGAG